MIEPKNILEIKDFGEIRLKFAEHIDNHKITRNKISDLSGVKYSIVDRYYKNNNIERVDLEILAKFCCVLQCSLIEILEYYPPQKS